MDFFVEKIVVRRQNIWDYLLSAALIFGGIIVIAISLYINILRSIWPLISAGIIYLIYLLITSRNIEFEYIVTNGDLDIDKIISKRKRKRIFSSNCRSFEKVAKYNEEAMNVENRLELVSSMHSPDVYFILLNHENKKTIVFFEPDERMLNSFKTYIPKKVFI